MAFYAMAQRAYSAYLALLATAKRAPRPSASFRSQWERFLGRHSGVTRVLPSWTSHSCKVQYPQIGFGPIEMFATVIIIEGETPPTCVPRMYFWPCVLHTV